MQQTLFGQSRTLRPQLQERIRTEISSNHCIIPWIVKHSQFLQNRFLTHEDGHTSYFRRWKRDYKGALCEFGETVLFRTAGKLKNKAGTAWHTGIWLGKDIEADESLVQCEGTVLKVRTVKGVIPSKQWNTELHKSLNSTPWDPKGKDDTVFVLPPSMVASGQVRPPPPPGLETEVPEEQTEETKSEERMGEEDDKESLRSLEQQNTDVRFPQLERVRSPKRSNEDELSDDDTREHKCQTDALISELPELTIGAISATTVDGDVPVSTNEDAEEIIEELKLVEPQLDYVENEFTEREVIDGMQTEMKSMKSFDVYHEIPIETCSQEDIDNALDGTWVKRRNTATKVRCRLCVRGCFPEAMRQDDVFASAPTLVTLRVLLLMTLSRCWTATTCDISTAFLHAPMPEGILMKPPSEYYPTGICLWLLKRAMYGLK